MENQGNIGEESGHEQGVVSLDLYKKEQIRNEFLSSYEEYLKLLDYNEIISEMKNLMTKVRRQALGFELSGQANLLIGEVSNRAQKDSPEMAIELRKMGANLSEKMKEHLLH